MKRPISLWLPLLAAALCLLLAGCAQEPQAEEAPGDPSVTELQAVLEADELAGLERYPNLRLADLSGSRCYEEMDAFADAHPELRLVYTLPLGASECSNEQRELTLREGEYELALLREALPHLRKLETLWLRETALETAELEELAALCPGELRFSVRFLDGELEDEVAALDLSGCSLSSLAPELPALSRLPALRELQLVDESGASPYSLEDALVIHDALPDARLAYRFTLYGKTVDTRDESLEYRDTAIGDEGLALLCRALELMPDCVYLKLDDCGTSNETMAALREEYAGRVKVVWRVHYGIFSDLTDTKVVHAVAAEHNTYLNDQMCEVLRYCEDTEYMDLGHNPLTTIEFCRSMPHLKAAILSYNNFTDLSPLENCRELYFLEIFSCRRLEDLSPLSACENLRMLNISFSTVKDITPVFALKKLELFHAARTEVPTEQFEALSEQLPDCRITYEGYDIHEVGWRKIRPGQYYDWYLELRDIFGYLNPNSYSHK